MKKIESTTYCRELEDKSGFVVVRTIVKSYKYSLLKDYVDPRWEEVLALGNTMEEALSNYNAPGSFNG
jgi:hypothetical protein